MKLYAKLESDRASKAQGGNEYVTARLFVGSAKESIEVAHILLRKIPTGYAISYRLANDRLNEIVLNEKGEKQ